ncbi:ComEC/Rec2 family competence protein [Lacticaseibacillus nasuensis]|uniref:ComEC/Rec2 family competence protein n=1 Tax=Lacticaseibacillus nasuensis TaxID=944671 RepID=UPI0022470966|nr:ComEC/Rec2 family competence protein [Lacticaseibacillus nasuensis]MCX2456473.1 ComEC/Rec2 family competence protein [Lacticaseibacillus nasuensis]
MTRQGIFWVVALIGGMLLPMGPAWLGGLALVWVLLVTRALPHWPVMLAIGLGVVIGWRAQAEHANPPLPQGVITVQAPDWRLQDGTVSFTGTAANGVPVSGLVTASKAQQAQLASTSAPQGIAWSGPPQRLTGARNQFEFDYADYAWASSQLAYEIPKQPLQLVAVPGGGVIAILNGWRVTLLRRMAQLPQRVGSYAKGLLLGQLDAEFDDVRQTYMDLGIFHLFSVSGLHLFALIGALYWLTDRLKIAKEHVDWVLIATLPTLLVILPFGAGIVRAVGMRVVMLLSERWHWAWSSLDCFSAVLALNLMWRPYVLYTFGGQLSYLLTGSLLLMSQRSAWGVSWRLSLLSAPVIIAHTFRVHVLTGAFNWLLLPIFELAIMPLLVVAVVWPTGPLTGGLELALGRLEHGLSAGAQLPGLLVVGAIGLPLAVVGVGVILRALGGRRWWPVLLWGVLAWGVAHYHPLARVTVFDVGQGDAILLEGENDQGVVLIDTGGRGFGVMRNPPAQRAILNYLAARGITRLDALVLTHPDADHVGDAAIVTHGIAVTQLITTASAAQDPYITKAAAGRVGIVRQVAAGTVLSYGALQLQVVSPAAETTATDKNADSVVLYGKIGPDRWLLTGDADQGVEVNTLMPLGLAVDYLKVGHHGSNTSSNPAFIAALNLKGAFISDGVANRYGHPHPETLQTFANLAVPIWRTDQGGMTWVEGGHIHQFLVKEETYASR